jgi:hypothetical protein
VCELLAGSTRLGTLGAAGSVQLMAVLDTLAEADTGGAGGSQQPLDAPARRVKVRGRECVCERGGERERKRHRRRRGQPAAARRTPTSLDVSKLHPRRHMGLPVRA